MISRRKATVLIAGAVFFAAGARAWCRPTALSTRLARSAAELAWSYPVVDPRYDNRPPVFAIVAMGLEATGLHAEAVDLLDAGFQIAADSTFCVSVNMAKLAWAGAYIGNRSLCRRCLNLARKAYANDRTGIVQSRDELYARYIRERDLTFQRMVERYARRIRDRDFAHRIDVTVVRQTSAQNLFDEINTKIIEGDLNAAIALATANPGRWGVGAHASAQALLARILAWPRELVVT